jgi:hypothetical protein
MISMQTKNLLANVATFVVSVAETIRELPLAFGLGVAEAPRVHGRKDQTSLLFKSYRGKPGKNPIEKSPFLVRRFFLRAATFTASSFSHSRQLASHAFIDGAVRSPIFLRH